MDTGESQQRQPGAVLAGGPGDLRKVMADIQADCQSLTSLLAVGLKDRTLVSGGQAKLVPAPRGSRGDEGKDSGVLGTVCSLADKAGFCCQKQGQKVSWHWSGLQGWGRSAPWALQM